MLRIESRGEEAGNTGQGRDPRAEGAGRVRGFEPVPRLDGPIGYPGIIAGWVGIGWRGREVRERGESARTPPPLGRLPDPS